MKYSENALRTLALKEENKLTVAGFWKMEPSQETLMKKVPGSLDAIEQYYKDILTQLERNGTDGFICWLDDEFPKFPQNSSRRKENPYLLFYKGDISLIKNSKKNVAVIGLINPTEDIIKREQAVVEQLVNIGCVIVSGLAKGCDTVAHRQCLDCKGKTVAILSTCIGTVYPAENSGLADEIVKKGGLLLTEYRVDASDRYEAVKRLTDRDRLQAILSRAVIMIASYNKNDDGDSGSRFAMEAAERYKIRKYVLYNSKTDSNNPRFALNRYYLGLSANEGKKEKDRVSAEILVHNSIQQIARAPQQETGKITGNEPEYIETSLYDEVYI